MKANNPDATICQKIVASIFYDESSGSFTWIASGIPAGSIDKITGYLRLSVAGHRIMAHRVAWLIKTGSLPEDQIDHRNGVRSDNRWENLRATTNSGNMENQRRARADSSTGLLGVKIAKKRFAAKITVRGKDHWLGTYDTPQEAHAIYLQAKRKLHEGCSL